MGNIQDLLAQILSARYGRDVRQSIHDAIETCYEDGHAGAIDLQARTLLGDTDISGISETVTGAVVELNGAVETAQTTADGAQSTADDALNGLASKQDVASALKYSRTSKTFTNITIPANSYYTFPIPIPDGVTNPRPIYARNISGTLVILNMYVLGSDMYIQLKNTSDTSITADQTVEVTFLYN